MLPCIAIDRIDVERPPAAILVEMRLESNACVVSTTVHYSACWHRPSIRLRLNSQWLSRGTAVSVQIAPFTTY
jgi:hypothetical protein